MNSEAGIRAASKVALELIEDGARLGLGSGRTVACFLALLGERCRQGLRVQGVPTSRPTAEEATRQGIPLIELTSDLPLDLTIDGADEVSPSLDLIKGWGGALVRERIVAAASRRQIVVVDEQKLVARLGSRGRLPVEIIPFAQALVMKRLADMGLKPGLRMDAAGRAPFLSDSGGLIIDCVPADSLSPAAARALEASLLAIPGVVDTGLFLGTAERVLAGHPDGTVVTLWPAVEADHGA